MRIELIMYSIKTLVESKTGATCSATHGPGDSKCFDSSLGSDYHKFIIFTHVFEFVGKTGLPIKLYLYYRNKRTINKPEFSSCELGMFTGKIFTPIFKEHINQLTEEEFAQLITDKVILQIESM